MLKVANSVISASRITGVLPVVNGGTGVTTSTGTGNTVLSASPTLSGDVNLSTGNLVIGTSGKGIDFSITSHPAGMTSELLADYEEGTWTVTATCGTSGTITLNSSFNTGKYTLVGNTVFFNAHLRVSAISSPVGFCTFSLPFTIVNGTNQNRAAGTVWALDITATAGDSIVLQLIENTAGVRFATQNALDPYFFDNATAGMIKATTEMSITGFFYVA